MFAVACSTLARPSLPVIGRRGVAHSCDRDGQSHVTSNLRAQPMSPRHPAAVIGNGTVDQTSDRLEAPEVGRVVVGVINSITYVEVGHRRESTPREQPRYKLSAFRSI
jgi:hypothetical protein